MKSLAVRAQPFFFFFLLVSVCLTGDVVSLPNTMWLLLCLMLFSIKYHSRIIFQIISLSSNYSEINRGSFRDVFDKEHTVQYVYITLYCGWKYSEPTRRWKTYPYIHCQVLYFTLVNLGHWGNVKGILSKNIF